ncbi:MAG: 16S rRNA (cytosine(1402)-N(4))-methyltransferase RsmH [Spirochaetaceae bacterium]|nr:16S rRNA (cytosine(1402)-N(4))-methyltransferase RsmH [Spirochaetaceae bacterium]MCF7947875.1 16S rRNA (cytosine(1402)-N(4))-methyltransferase RsmH [Spirochaetia bacterium]MCF7951397.1 16S rRNA (cytosine(1402)-N(4))-methyltransferase RsmH [Spirochaetaceae bacterium]
MDTVHYSVLQQEVLQYLVPPQGEGLFIDCTLGEGGHSELVLQENPGIKLVGLDADAHILEIARQRLEPFKARVRLYNTWFNTFFREYPLGGERPDAILFDLGISIFHYERAGRGFSFQKEEPLDMRLDTTLEISAYDIINTYPEKELARIFFEYGEERYSRMIAAAIVRERAKSSIETSAELAQLIKSSVPAKYRYGRIHPATRSFQALRIMVNGELARLNSVLEDALGVLKVGGRIGVISFHSLEDRIVKQFLQKKSQTCTCPPEWPICKCGGQAVVKLIQKKPIQPSDDEVDQNAPSRSAKLRVAEKLMDEER